MSSAVSVKVKWDNQNLSRISQKAVTALFRLGTNIGNQARRNAPYKTGALRNSIRVRESGDAVEVIAGGDMGGKAIRYAAIQEFGGTAGRHHSVHITGKHYMERAKDLIMSGDYIKKYFGDLL